MSNIVTSQTKFKGIDKNPSLLGFGCMRLPVLRPGEPAIDEVLAEKMIDEAYRRGVNYFDTAYPYHQGMSELFVGKALKKYPRESFYLADKMPSWLLHSVEDAKRIFQEQLDKCQVTYFDYYLCHALNRDNFKNYQLPGVMDFLYQMKKEGKIRHLGFSFHDSPEILDKIIHTFEWDFVQIQFNYLDWTFQDSKRQYEIVQEYGVPCIVMEPVRGGTLATLSDQASAIFKAADPDASVASWAIRYAASHENVLVVLSGMSNEEQTLDNLKTMSDFRPLTEADQAVIDKALDEFLKSRIVPCTSCQYCMPCPQGVNIPLMFSIYNSYQIGKHAWEFMQRFEATDPLSRAENCIACGLCMDHCPQHIQIPDRMVEIQELYQQLKAEQKK